MLELEKDARKYICSNGVNSLVYDDYVKNFKPMGYVDPTVIEERRSNMSVISIYGRLLMDRIIFLGSEIDSDVANIISAQMLWLDSLDKDKDIVMHVASPGGSVYAGYEILDTMELVKADISTVSMGLVASMASVIATSGTEGKRLMLPRARFMIHQPLGGAHGQASDILISAREIEGIRSEIYTILSEHSNLSYEEIEKMADRDCFLKADDALKYGFVDEIVKK